MPPVPIELELRTWESPHPLGGVLYHRNIVYKDTEVPVSGEVLLDLHSRLEAVGYFVKCKSTAFDACSANKFPYGGYVTAVSPDRVVTVGLPPGESGKATNIPGKLFLELYEVD